ncbi:MAG TPA: undecaprenyl-phosphate glucose phosphotransferase [Flavobacteriales bacterium]|nr:undecaprenyl-phosphate glucose phosphotransferase [Flavobacteriales bacterium]
MKGYSRYFWAIHFAGDLLFINIAFIVTYYIKFETFLFSDKYKFLLLIFNFIWTLTAFLLKLYDIKSIRRLDRVLFNLFKAALINGLVLSGILFSLKASTFSREHLYATYAFSFGAVLVWRILALQLIHFFRKSGFNYKRVILIGGGNVAKQLYNYIHKKDVFGIRLLGIFTEGEISFQVKENIKQGNFDDLQEFAIKNDVDEIYYTLPLTYTAKIKEFISFADKNMIRFKIIPDFRSFPFKRVNIDFFEDVPVITFRQEPLTDIVNQMIKRTFDVVFSFLVIALLLSWLYPLITLLIKLSSKGPVLFKQVRSGLNNEEFMCFKFRSMAQNEDADDLQASKGDARITKIGNFLRKSSLDELPQFINVLMGDMSVVGPRPHMLKHTEEYSALIGKYMVRQLVKPGITGVAQVKGYRGETKELKDMEGRVRADVWYIENWSLALDLNLVALTVWNVIKGDEKAY